MKDNGSTRKPESDNNNYPLSRYKEARRRCKRKYYQKTHELAKRTYQRWDSLETIYIMISELPDVEICKQIKRSLGAIHNRRAYVKKVGFLQATGKEWPLQ